MAFDKRRIKSQIQVFVYCPLQHYGLAGYDNHLALVSRQDFPVFCIYRILHHGRLHFVSVVTEQ